MINKRDINKLRTPEDLERKYNLSDIFSLKENYELQKTGLNKVENELNKFIKITADNLEELQNQVDGNITTWFYSGVPTESNEPASEWTTTDEKNNHLGDLYYDKETGYAYRYSLENDVYGWMKITDNDVTEALAIANSAKDVADSKRRVFVVEPTTPYDCGDLWIKDEELYRCQTTKTGTETFEENDWIIATKYTDDTVANQVGENLNILSGTVTEIRKDVNSLTTTMTNTTELVDEQGKSLDELQVKQSETKQSVDSFDISIRNIQTSLETQYGTIQTLGTTISNMKYSFGTEALKIADENSKTNALFSNTGVKIFNYSTLSSIFTDKGTGVDKLIVTGTAQIGYLKFVKSIKNGKKCTTFFHLNNLVEDLQDLESD